MLFYRQWGERMAALTEKIVSYCVRNNVISESDEVWLRYGIEKRMPLLLGFIPQITLAACLSNLSAAIGYMASFYLLRKKLADIMPRLLSVACVPPYCWSLYFSLVYILIWM